MLLIFVRLMSLLAFVSLTIASQFPQINPQHTGTQATNKKTNMQSHQLAEEQQKQLEPSQGQFVNEMNFLSEFSKDTNVEKNLNYDPYAFLNKLEHEVPAYRPWNPYSSSLAQQSGPLSPARPFENFPQFSSIPHMPKFMPMFGYPQPIFIPYPFFVTPDMFYSGSQETSTINAEESLSRAANGRRPTTSSTNFQRNSPIYYVRLPPTPYMFLPSLGYTPPTTPSFTPMMPYSSLTAIHALPLSSVFNLPLNFLANGKPNGIYRIDAATNDLQNPLPLPASGPNFYRPNYGPRPQVPQYGFSSPPPPQHDSKLNMLKPPFVFNGRPENIYILPNNFNSLYHDGAYY